MEFVHIGVVTDKPQEHEEFNEELKVYITDPKYTEFKYEYLRFVEGSPLPEIMQKNPHVAYKVKNMDKYLSENEVIVEPFNVGDNLKCAFIINGGFIIELMQEC
ncbi:hypothetical protein HGQ85_09145 [Clostridioides difficile]|nr:hypothetical protein [Clostridioides difficile]